MAVIDSDNFIAHLVWSGLIDKATCGELKEAIELCTVKDIYTKADMVAMLSELKYDLYPELCKEIHGKEDCPCVGQTISCLATFRVCDADRAIGRTIQQKINALTEGTDGR